MILSHSSHSSPLSVVSSSLVPPNTAPRVKLTSPQVEPAATDRSRDEPLVARHGCSCCRGRRSLFTGATATTLLPVFPSNALSSYKDVLEKFHPPRPDWYEEFYASVMNTGMKSYEAEIAGYKSELFASLRGKARKVLEIGIGTGPNLSYYAGENDIRVYGVDPNKKMEKYAEAAAVSAGLPLPNFKLGRLYRLMMPPSMRLLERLCFVLLKMLTWHCKVKRVLRPGGLYLFIEHVAAKGTALRFVQSVLDPLQQTLSDGCHLTRETGKLISEAGFSDLKLNMAFLSNVPLINPHVYGIAYK